MENLSISVEYFEDNQLLINYVAFDLFDLDKRQVEIGVFVIGDLNKNTVPSTGIHVVIRCLDIENRKVMDNFDMICENISYIWEETNTRTEFELVNEYTHEHSFTLATCVSWKKPIKVMKSIDEEIDPQILDILSDLKVLKESYLDAVSTLEDLYEL